MTHTAFAIRNPRCVHLTRKALMMSCASAALATAALMPQPARAQAFQGSITSSTGSVNRAMPTGTTETITIGSSTATINWSPTNQQAGGPAIDFLPNGNTATFTSTQGLGDYTVLNRILPDSGQAIALNGHVVSTLQGTSATGGRVWFYSPGGIVIGATAVFDVGSLLLTTNDLVGAEGNVAAFAGAAGSASRIQVQNGAQINAVQPGSYVAMIAPRIEQGGKVRVNGTAAYVAAEAATMTMNQGLFDIQVDVGTTDANGIVHTGETSGPASAAAADPHRIYMVAVPKNQALTMLLSGGTVGFDATSASVENGQVVLSSGQGVSGDSFTGQEFGGAVGGPASGITISGGHYTSTVNAGGTGEVQGNGGGGTLTFDHDVNLQGLGAGTLLAFSGETVNVHGNAHISSDDWRGFDTANPELGLDAHGGWAEIRADSGGNLTIDGTATVTADARSGTNYETLTGGISNGGTALLGANGGNVTIGGATMLSATGYGDTISHAGIDGRDSWGGLAEITANNSGSVHIGGNLQILGEGQGSSTALASGGTGGTGHGGVADVSTYDHGSLTVGGTMRLSSAGVGGTVLTSPDATGGTGYGGQTGFSADLGSSITLGGNATLTASGFGADSPAQAGDGHGGSTYMLINGGSIDANGALQLYADGTGGSGQIAGNGYGGQSFADISGVEGVSAGGTLDVTGDFRVQAGGHGGVGRDNAAGAGGVGGDGYSGSSRFYISPDLDSEATVSVHLANVFVTNNGEGGNGGNGLTGGDGGNGYGYVGGGEGGYYSGDSRIEIWAGNVTAGDMQVFSTSRGGNAGNGSAGVGGTGGDAYGGRSDLLVGGTLTATRALSYDRAFGGNGGSGTTMGDGGYASGGYAQIDLRDGGHITGNIDMATTAFGGSGNSGGDSYGGYSYFGVNGALTGGTISVVSDAFGGSGLTAGGNATGGTAMLEAFTGTGSLTASGGTTITAIAYGGDGTPSATGTGGRGGDGFGGDAEITSGGGTDLVTLAEPTARLAFGDVSLNAKGEGGTGGNGITGGAGGSGEAGYSAITLDGGETMTAGDTQLLVRGVGGDGGTGSEGVGGAGGAGYGGSASLWVGSGSSLTGTTYGGSTNGVGGNGGAGTAGRGDGGSAQSGEDSASIGGSVTYGGTTDAHNGFIVTSYAMGGNGGIGGSASAGSSSIDVSGSLTVTGQVQSTAQAGAGNGDTVGGGAYGGSASINVSGTLNTGNLHVANVAVGGNGSTSGGEAYGGYASFSADGGTAHIGNIATLQVTATGGNASNGTGGYARGGDATFSSFDGGTITGGDLTMNADATAGIGLTNNGAEAGSIGVQALGFNADRPNTMAMDDMNLSAVATANGSSSEGTSPGYIYITAIGGTISANTLMANVNSTNFGGLISLESGDFGDSPAHLNFGTVTATANGGDIGGNIYLSTASGSTMDLGDATLTASGGFGGLVYLAAGSCGECGSGLDAATHAAALPAGGGIGANNLTLTTSGNIIVGLTDGADVSVTGTLKGTAGQSISLIDDGTGGAIRAHVIDLSAITILDQADLVADIIRLTSGSDMNLGALSASNSITLTSGGDLATGDLTAGNSLTLDSGGSVGTGNLTAPIVSVTADDDSSVGNVTASNSASFTAGGLAEFHGIVRSPDITVTSGDIDIADGASLGVFGITNSITFNANGRGQAVIIGDGPAAEGQYSLNEDGDIQSAAVTINSDTDVKVYDAHIDGSATSGGGTSAVALNSQGSVFVLGLVDFTNAGTTDGLTIKAGNRIEVNTDAGGIQITDSTGKLTGELNLTAKDIWVASGSVLAQLETNPNFTGRDTALGTNSGTANQDGFLRAGTINALIGETLLVQNSGTADLFGGIDTGGGGLSIETVGTTPATVVAYGRQTNPDGTVITNQDFLGSVDLTGTGGFTTDSAVNGCAIGATCTQEVPFTIDMASILGPLDQTNSPDDEKKKDKDEGEDSDDGSSVDPSLKLINTTPINLDKTVDEPVTSGGDVVIGGQ